MTEGPALLTASFDDAGTFERALTDGKVSCIQTNKGSIKLDFSRCASTRISLQLTSIPLGSLVTIGKSHPTAVSFHIPLGNASRVSIAGHRMNETSFVAYGPDSEHAISASHGSCLAYLVPRQDLLEEAFLTLLGRVPPSDLVDSNIIQTDPRKLDHLRTFLHEVGAMISLAPHVLSNPEVYRSVKHALMSLLLSAYSADDKAIAGPGRTPISRCKTLQRIDDELERNASQPVYVKDLCQATGVSQATLYRVFYDVLGMSPKRYLQLRRLHLLRAKLLRDPAPDRTVSSIAYDCGFWQLGRMGQSYRELFGETPQKTLQRARKM